MSRRPYQVKAIVNGEKVEFGGTCPFRTCMEKHDCVLDKSIDCRFGLTEIQPPKDCPLRKGSVSVHTGPEQEKP